MKGQLPDLLLAAHEDFPTWVDEFLRASGNSWQSLEEGTLLKTLKCDLNGFVFMIAGLDPVRFVECFFREREEDGHPSWRLFDYQKATLRWPGNLILCCGAETGKTRELLGKVLWRAMTKRGDQLFAAALDSHLEMFWTELEFQLDHPFLSTLVDEGRSKKSPYKEKRFTNGNLLYLRPAGLEGNALKAAHVTGGLYMDEAPSAKDPMIWSNFYSRAKPGCPIEIVGVPDGDVGSEFTRKSLAVPESDPLAGPSLGTPLDAFPVVRWSKELMPAPYWTPERETFFVTSYGGKEDSRYQQNVLGRNGDPANSVFPWAVLKPTMHFSPDYRHLRLVNDPAGGAVFFSAYRLNPDFLRLEGDDAEAGSAANQVVHYQEDTFQTTNFDFAALLARHIGMVVGSSVIGADLGRNEPTEVVVQRLDGQRTRDHCRITLKGFSYDTLDELLRVIDLRIKPSHGWGIDAGGVGAVVSDHLESCVDGHFVDLSRFVLNAKTPALSPDTLEAATDRSGKPELVTFLELGIRFLEYRIQRGRGDLPHDPDLIRQFTGLQSVNNSRGERSFRGEDHLVHAHMVAELRLLEMEVGLGSNVIEFAVSKGGGRRDGTSGRIFNQLQGFGA